MTYLKTLGLFAVTAVAMMGFAGSASATFTSPTGTEYTGEIDLSAESSVVLKAGVEVTCTESLITVELTTNDTTHASGQITTLLFGGCNALQTTVSNGSITIKNDEVIAIGSAWTVERAGIDCTYSAVAGTKIGTATNTTLNGKDAVTLDINAELSKVPPSSIFCASKGLWSGSYVITYPVENYLDFT